MASHVFGDSRPTELNADLQELSHDAEDRAGPGPSGRTTCQCAAWGHILRHTFCSHLAMRGAPARAIQASAGHQDLSTTQRYMHVSPAVVEDAIRLLDQPVFRRGDSLETVRKSGLNAPIS